MDYKTKKFLKKFDPKKLETHSTCFDCPFGYSNLFNAEYFKDDTPIIPTDILEHYGVEDNHCYASCYWIFKDDADEQAYFLTEKNCSEVKKHLAKIIKKLKTETFMEIE